MISTEALQQAAWRDISFANYLLITTSSQNLLLELEMRT
jgi:hypothetical protein